MVLHRTTLLLAAVVLALPAAAYAQPVTDQSALNSSLTAHVAVAARAASDSITLRWGVTKPAVWLIGNRVGYVVERAEAPVGSGLPTTLQYTRVAGPVLPWSHNEWERYFETHTESSDASTSDYATMAVALIDTSEGGNTDEGVASDDDLAAVQDRRSRLDMRFGFALYAADRSIAAAQGLGLRFVDRTMTPSRRYVYRVYLAGPSSVYRVDTGYVTTYAASERRLPWDRKLRAVEDDGRILLNWFTKGEFSAWRVERSSDKGRTFQRVTPRPVLSIRPEGGGDSALQGYQDTTVVNYTLYRYRIFGATAFADEELIGEIDAMPRDRTPPGRPFVPNPEQVGARAVKIVWTMTEPVARDLAGFMVLRDTAEAGPYNPINGKLLPPNTRDFIDTTFSPIAANYYSVAAFDTAGNVILSSSAYVALMDSTPPEQPLWLKGTMDSNGVVTLVLHGNHERDCMGYRILRANAPEHEFSSIIESYGGDDHSAARDTVLRDTVAMATLTKWVYYRAIALDWHFNESPLSEILAVPRPDIIPPAAPVISDVGVTDSSVVLEIVPSPSEDVARHTLYRREGSDIRWDSIASLARDVQHFADRAVRGNVRYDYTLDAVDSAGLRSERAVAVSARPYKSGLLPAVTDLKVRYDSAAHHLELTWNHPGLAGAHSFIVYRSIGGAGLQQVGRVASAQHRYVDSSIGGAGTYEYIVKVVDESGGESLPSERGRAEVR